MPGPMRFAFFTAAVVMTGFVGALVWTEWRHPPDIIQRSPTSSRLLAIGLPALPEGRLVRAREVVEAVYEFAARHPDVLRDVPCFCGCARLGHRSNLDCFVDPRGQAQPVTWNAHGMG